MPVRAKLAMICALNYLWWAAREAKQHALIQVLGFVLRHAWRNQLANRMLHHRHPEGWTLTSPGRDPSQQGHGPPYSPIKPMVFSHMGGPTTASLTNGDICTSVFSRFGYQKRSKVVPHSWKESPWHNTPLHLRAFHPPVIAQKKWSSCAKEHLHGTSLENISRWLPVHLAGEERSRGIEHLPQLKEMTEELKQKSFWDGQHSRRIKYSAPLCSWTPYFWQ